MACGATGTCGGSGCYNQEENDPKILDTTITNPSPPHNSIICHKCKVEQVVESTGGLCKGCFGTSLYGKFKQAVTTQDLISGTDNVLVAFSGGPSSRVALQFVHEMQHKAQMNLDASRDKLYPVFGVGVAFIDESAVTSIPSHDLDNAIEDLRSIVSSLAPPTKNLHIMPIQSIFSSDSKEGRNKLNLLVQTVPDATGKEDLLHHLRMLSLQKIAFDNKYNKLILGSCTSRIACHVIQATVKGQGYSLPADIQYIDGRWDVPVVLPLRDCLSQELNRYCFLNSLKTLNELETPRSGINNLVSTFIALLQEENPARERTIVRTAEKLIPFHFNSLAETNDSNTNLRRRRKKVEPKEQESNSSEFLCSICCSPISKLDLEGLNQMSCCTSCQFQILPKEESLMEEFYSLLPNKMIARGKDFVGGGQQAWIREQIQDCLLSDTEDGT